MTDHGLSRSDSETTAKSPPMGAPARAATAWTALSPGSTRIGTAANAGSSATSNTAEAMPKMPASPPETTATRSPASARSRASRARSRSTVLPDACRVSPARCGTRLT